MAGLAQILHFLTDQRAEFPVSVFFRGRVADATPREEVWTVADVLAVFFAPAHKSQVLVFGFHLVTSRMA